MDLYRLLWDEKGYARCHARIMATNASHNRKLAALNRVWNRKRRLYTGYNGRPEGQLLIRMLLCNV
jgi:hypothetical protein